MLRYISMKNKTRLVYIFIFFIQLCYSQNTLDRIPLTELLTSLENKFDVKFSYAYEDVITVSIEKPNPNLNLQQTLNYLNNKTLLNFKTLDNRYITVSVLEKAINVCGIVISKETEEPLFGASVYVNNTNKGVITNESGKFQLNNIPLKAVLTISYLGFKGI